MSEKLATLHLGSNFSVLPAWYASFHQYAAYMRRLHISKKKMLRPIYCVRRALFTVDAGCEVQKDAF